MTFFLPKVLLLLAAQIWTVLAFDPKGDGRDPSLPDAAQLVYRFDAAQDMIWFRVAFYDTPHQQAVHVNITTDKGVRVSGREMRIEGKSIAVGFMRTDLCTEMKMN